MNNLDKLVALGLAYEKPDGSEGNTVLLDTVYRIIRSLDNWNDSTGELQLAVNSQVEVYVDKGDIIYMGTIEYLYGRGGVLEGDYRGREVECE